MINLGIATSHPAYSEGQKPISFWLIASRCPAIFALPRLQLQSSAKFLKRQALYRAVMTRGNHKTAIPENAIERKGSMAKLSKEDGKRL
jgi:hypothetical protein